MSADKHPAEVLADRRRIEGPLASWQREAEAMLRRIPALEAERDKLRAEIGRRIRQVEAADPQVEALLEQRDQLRAEVQARTDADIRSSIAAWDQIKRLQGEANVLRRLLAESRDVLGTIDSDDAPDKMAALLAAIDAALDPTSREAQQMSITEASRGVGISKL